MLADDDLLVRSGIAMLLNVEPDIEVVAEVGDAPGAVAAVLEHEPDVAIVDVRMPGGGGIEATRAITADDTTARVGHAVGVLALTNYHVSEAVYGCLRAGASGFLLKDAAPAELVLAVQAVAKGDAWLDPAVARELVREFAQRPESSLPSPSEVAALTPREREVLVLLAHGLSNQEIAEHLVVEHGTVKTHVSRVLMKLGVRDRAQAVAVAYRSRLVGPDDPPPRRT